MVHGGKTNVRLVILSYANLKKACEFSFLQLDESQELTSCNCTHGETSYQGVYTERYLMKQLSQKSILSTLYHQIFESVRDLE